MCWSSARISRTLDPFTGLFLSLAISPSLSLSHTHTQAHTHALSHARTLSLSLSLSLLQVLLKCADISNPAKRLPIAGRWALRVTDEFFLQVPKTHLYQRLLNLNSLVPVRFKFVPRLQSTCSGFEPCSRFRSCDAGRCASPTSSSSKYALAASLRVLVYLVIYDSGRVLPPSMHLLFPSNKVGSEGFSVSRPPKLCYLVSLGLCASPKSCSWRYALCLIRVDRLFSS